MLGRRQRPPPELDQRVIGGQASHRRPDRIGVDPAGMLGGRLGCAAHRLRPSRQELEARHVRLARVPRDRVTPRDRQPGPVEADPDRALGFADLDDVAVDHDRPGRFTSARTSTNATTIAMTSATRLRSGPSPLRPEQVLHVESGTADETAGVGRPAPTDRAQELDDQEEDHPQESSRQDEERRDGRDDHAGDAGSGSDGIGEGDSKEHREWHGDGEQTGDDAEQHADPPASVGVLDTRSPQIRQPRETDAHQASRDEDHRRGRCRAHDRRLGSAAGGCQEHPQSGNARETRSERGFRDPFIVETGRVRGSPKHGEPEKDPGRVHAEHDGRLLEHMSRRRPQRQQPADQRRSDGGRGERGPIVLSTGVPRGPRDGQADQGRAGEGDEGQGACRSGPARNSTVTYTSVIQAASSRAAASTERAASGDAFERIGRLPVGIKPVPGTRHPERARLRAPTGGTWSERGVRRKVALGAEPSEGRDERDRIPAAESQDRAPQRGPACDIGKQPLERHGGERADIREPVGHLRDLSACPAGWHVDGPLRTVAECVDRETTAIPFPMNDRANDSAAMHRPSTRSSSQLSSHQSPGLVCMSTAISRSGSRAGS